MIEFLFQKFVLIFIKLDSEMPVTNRCHQCRPTSTSECRLHAHLEEGLAIRRLAREVTPLPWRLKFETAVSLTVTLRDAPAHPVQILDQGKKPCVDQSRLKLRAPDCHQCPTAVLFSIFGGAHPSVSPRRDSRQCPINHLASL